MLDDNNGVISPLKNHDHNNNNNNGDNGPTTTTTTTNTPHGEELLHPEDYERVPEKVRMTDDVFDMFQSNERDNHHDHQDESVVGVQDTEVVAAAAMDDDEDLEEVISAKDKKAIPSSSRRAPLSKMEQFRKEGTLQKEQPQLWRIKSPHYFLQQQQEQSPSRRLAAMRRAGCGYIGHLLSDYHSPRTHALLLKVTLPLFILIFVSMGCGAILAHYEAPIEIASNDQIMKHQYLLQLTDATNWTLDLTDFARLCLESSWNSTINITAKDGNTTIISNYTLQDLIDLDVFADTDDFKFHNISSVEDPSMFLLQWMQTGLTQLEEDFEICQDESLASTQKVLDIRKDLSSTAGESPSFDWIRCWNATEVGSHSHFVGTSEQIHAAQHQSEYYWEIWRQDQARLFSLYLKDDHSGHDDSEFSTLLLLPEQLQTEFSEAFWNSVENASGGGGCSNNLSGSAWFWFTILSTIGYGNQAPVSREGRILVVVAGFFSILAFAKVLSNAGFIMSVISEDVIKRSIIGKYLYRHRAAFGSIWWGMVATCWIFFVAFMAQRFWTNRLEDPDLGKWDAEWYAFISTTTVGLGDFFLQPDVIFLSDVVGFMVMFLLAFVSWSAFLTTTTTVISNLCPRRRRRFKERISKTDPFNFDENEGADIDADDDDDDDDLEPDDEVRILKELLKARTQKFDKRRVEQNLETLAEEEKVLQELLKNVSEERTKVQRSVGPRLRDIAVKQRS